MEKRSKWIRIAPIFVCVILIAAILGWVILEFNSYAADPLPNIPPPEHFYVFITSPSNHSQFFLGAPIIVQATAFTFGSEPISSVELYIDGELIGVESAPEGGSDNILAEFLWSPSETGVYDLAARAIGVIQQTMNSPVALIEIIPSIYDLQAGDSTDYALPVPAGLEIPPILPDPDSPFSPAQPWKGTPGNWLNSLVTKTAPNPPELAASLEGCNVALSIHDLSDNEEGFEVWRALPNSPAWARIAVLASQSQEVWIAYQDDTAQGATTYYVSAFNSKGFTDSNLVRVFVDPDDCKPPTDPSPVLTLKLENMETFIPVDKFYCYVSLDGEGWIRRPELGFWSGRTASQEGGSFDVEIISLSLTGDAEIGPKTFYLDCWGWLGGSLHYLGAFSQTLNPNQEGGVQVGSENFSALAAVEIVDPPDQPKFYPMGGSGSYGYEFGFDDDAMQVYEINPWLKKIPIEPSMPFISAFITDVPESCRGHLPPQYQNEDDMTFFCSPSPGFDLGPNVANPQPYFNWDPNQIPRCPNGQGPQCKSYYYWLSLAADLGHEIGFNVYDQNSKGFHIIPVTVPELFNYTIPPVPCSGTRDIWVQMWYYDSASLLPSYGPPSNKASIPCPVALGPNMFLDVRFDQLVFSGIEDDESAPQDIEAFGYLRASSESMTRYLNLATWQSFVSFCPDEEGFINNQKSSQPGCPISFMDGSHSLSDQPLCRSVHYNSCSESGWDLNNNTLRLVIEDGDSLTLSATILDKDSSAASDLVCEGTIQFPGQTILDWHKMKDQVFIIQGSSTYSGTCHIFGTLNAVSP